MDKESIQISKAGMVIGVRYKSCKVTGGPYCEHAAPIQCLAALNASMQELIFKSSMPTFILSLVAVACSAP